MQVLVKYLGQRAEKLGVVGDKDFRSGPYDFTSGQALMDEQDAEVIVTLSPIGFCVIGPPVADPVDKKEDKKKEVGKSVA